MGNSDLHFKYIFWFVCCVCFICLVLIGVIIFVPMPKSGEESARTTLIFLLGYVSAQSGYLTNGSPKEKEKTNAIPGKTTAEFNATVITDSPNSEDASNTTK